MSEAVHANRDLTERETRQIVLMLNGLDGTIADLAGETAIADEARRVHAVFDRSERDGTETRAIVATSDLLEIDTSRVRQILRG